VLAPHTCKRWPALANAASSYAAIVNDGGLAFAAT